MKPKSITRNISFKVRMTPKLKQVLDDYRMCRISNVNYIQRHLLDDMYDEEYVEKIGDTFIIHPEREINPNIRAVFDDIMSASNTRGNVAAMLRDEDKSGRGDGRYGALVKIILDSEHLDKNAFIEKFSKTNISFITDIEAWDTHQKYYSGEWTKKQLKQYAQQKNPKSSYHGNKLMRGMGLWPIKLPCSDVEDDNIYTDVAMAIRGIKSYINGNKYRAEEKKRLLDEFKASRANIKDEDYVSFIDFKDECSACDFGLYYGFIKGFNKLSNFPHGFTSRNRYVVPLNILKQEKYKRIWDEQLLNKIFKCYQKWCDYTRWNERGSVHFITSTDNVSMPFSIKGTNFPPATLSIINDRISCTLACITDDKKEKISLECIPSRQGKDYKIVQASRSKDCTLQYNYGKRLPMTVEGTVKEITLIYKNGEYSIGIPYTQPKTYPLLNQYTTDGLKSYLNSNLKKPKKEKIDIPYGTRTMSIDLNKNPVISYCISELKKHPTKTSFPATDGLGHIDIIAEGHVGGPYYGDILNIPECCRSMRMLKHAVRICREFKKTNELKEGDQEIFKTLAQQYNIVAFEYDYYTCKDIVQTSFTALQQQKRDINTKIHAIITEYEHTNDRDQAYVWAEMLYEIELEKAYSGLVTSLYAPQQYDNESDEQFEVRKNRINRPSAKRSNNMKEDLRKKTTFEVKYLLKKYGCSVLLHEDLSSISSINSRKDNELWAIMAPRTLIDSLTQMAEQLQVAIVPVNPSLSSQIIYDTQEFGYRDKTNKHNIYYVENGQIQCKNSDINAAYNIMYMAWTRHKDIYRLYCNQVSDDVLLVQTEGKYTEAALGKYAIMSKDGDDIFKCHKTDAKTAKQYKKQTQKVRQIFYKNNSHFIPQPVHKGIQKLIEHASIGERSGDAKTTGRSRGYKLPTDRDLHTLGLQSLCETAQELRPLENSDVSREETYS